MPTVIAAVSAARIGRCDSPLGPPRLYSEARPRGTLTLLTGAEAGRFVATDGSALVVGCDADADFVVDEPGVDRHHARVARTPGGAFYVEDLQSANGTFVGTNRLGLSLLRGEEIIRLGPKLLVRFALVDE